MENESLPRPGPEHVGDTLAQQDEALIRRTAHNAEKLAVALGLPREAKYDVLAALSGSAVEAFTQLKETYGVDRESQLTSSVDQTRDQTGK